MECSSKKLNSVKIWQNYGYESVAPLLAHPVYSADVENQIKGALRPGACIVQACMRVTACVKYSQNSNVKSFGNGNLSR